MAILIGLAACATGDRGPAVPPTPATISLERQVHSLVNAHRASKRLASLAWSDVIADQARRHSQNMAAGRTRFGHGGLGRRLENIKPSIPWSRAAENAAISRSASGALTAWLKSRGHKRAIEGNYDLTGIGVARSANGSVYFTQIFVKAK